jgi:hypothetical protein
MCHAIAQLHRDPCVIQEDNSNPESELVLLGTHLRDVILRSFSSSDDPHGPKHFQAADDASYAGHEALDHSWKIGDEHGGIFKDDMRIQSWAKRYSRVKPIRVEGDPELHGLNATQIRAVAMMVGERISLIHGVSAISFRIFLYFFNHTLAYLVASWNGKEQNDNRGRAVIEGVFMRMQSRGLSMCDGI